MAQDGHNPSRGRNWMMMETHVLLDLIRDIGLVPVLTRKGYQNWDVFERLHVLLKRCNVRFSAEEIKAHWQGLKVKFWRLKRLAGTGVTSLSGLTTEFPFYEEMEHLLGPQSRAWTCRREADSTGQEVPVLPASSLLSDSGFLSEGEDEDEVADGASSGHQEGEHDRDPPGQNVGDPEPVMIGAGQQEAARMDGDPQPTLAAVPGAEPAAAQDCMRLLQAAVEQLLAVMERLVLRVERLSGVEEQVSIQLGYVCSLVRQMVERNHSAGAGPASQEQEVAPDTAPRSSRVLRRSLRSKRPSVRYHP
ncbi:uncharacterized protein LOC142483322 isoform X2 [Ascaphus truei]|uniref:uncharacterized protein LOC142483322 isoform X2 n=1 Tax=Ascaphus truei TaxID=8439 RepID=UPI003F5A89D8